MRQAIADLLQLGAVHKCKHTSGQFISSIFLRQKPNGKFRFILNLKSLNKFIKTEHFKMENIRTATKIIDRNFYMCSIDLKESYFLVNIAPEHRKYLRFEFENALFEFTAMPYGLSTAPSTFTKLMKPVVSYLRGQGFLSTLYLDDYLCIGRSYDECIANRDAALHIFQCLGLIVNYEKSVRLPSTSCKFLGFILNTEHMTLELPQEKQGSIRNIITKFLHVKTCKIREFAKLLGTLVAACPAIQYGPGHLKIMERIRYLSLLNTEDNYDAIVKLPSETHQELKWWLHNIDNRPYKSFSCRKFQLEIFSDASLTGWGIHCNGESVGGLWSQSEQKFHINQLELLAAFFGLKCFASTYNNCDILLRIDNTTAIACINKMGSIQFPHLNDITRNIWNWCESRDINVQASYIKSKENCLADKESRNTNIDTEWELNDRAFSNIVTEFGTPNIDLFASRINKKSRYQETWDPGIVLRHITSLPCNSTLTLEALTKKLVTTLALATAQRVQTLSSIKLEDINISNNKITIIISDLLKTSVITRKQTVIELPFYLQNPKICPASTLQEYIERTKAIRNHEKYLLITFKKPHHRASKQSISRWIKNILYESGIDINKYTSHSTRHSATSTAKKAGVSLDVIRKTAGWSQNSLTFAKFYNLPTQENHDNNEFLESVFRLNK
ncbi:hypothetical protein K1T71_014839 [Dendrolimus kikuchii]|nr:hypothetical protein K1T71_014839 [Dendrolimus kikuchii]